MNQKQLKQVGFLAIAIVIINFFLFIFTIINWTIFLIVLALGYAFVKFGLPRLKS